MPLVVALELSPNERPGLVTRLLEACRFRHHCHASIPSPASAAPRILLGAKVSFLTRLLFPNPNMMLPPVSGYREDRGMLGR